MPKRAKWAENHLASLCGEEDGVATPPGDDVNGWDLMLEFPEKTHNGTATQRPAIQFAFIQVKSTISRDRRVQIKLSNVLKSCRQPQPWFILLVVRDPKKGIKEIYGLHVWKEHMAAGLKAVHQASVNGVLLHRKRLTVLLPESAKITEGVVSWMQGQIDSCGENYGVTKQALADTLGYEEGYGLASLTIEGQQEDFVLAVLGLKKSIRAKSFSFTPARFGIPEKAASIEGLAGELEFQPTPKGVVNLNFRGPEDAPSLDMTADVYTFGTYDDLDSTARLRFSAPPVELVWSPATQRTKALFQMEWTQRITLSQLGNYATLCDWSHSSEIKVEIWNGANFLLSGSVNFPKSTITSEPKLLRMIHEALNPFQVQFSLYDIRLSLNDLNQAIERLGWFAPVSSNGSFRIEIPLPDLNPPDVKSFLYYLIVWIDDWTFASIVRRVVTEDIIIDETRRFTTGKPIVLERFMSKGDRAAVEARVKQAYARVVESYEAKEVILDFGDMIDWGKKSKEGLDPGA